MWLNSIFKLITIYFREMKSCKCFKSLAADMLFTDIKCKKIFKVLNTKHPHPPTENVKQLPGNLEQQIWHKNTPKTSHESKAKTNLVIAQQNLMLVPVNLTLLA